MTPDAFETHDHDTCIATAVATVESECAERKLQFTPVRRRVFEILMTEHKAMGAYEILDHLRAEGLGSQPPVVYRALDFLVSNGFAHRVEKLNAFVACAHPGHSHSPAFLICRSCGLVSESASNPETGALGKAAASTGFDIEQAVVEAEGLCPECQP